jgi:hypothetical protein
VRVKKHNGEVYGADFSTAEREAVDLEVGRLIAEANRKNAANFDALVLYVLMAYYGWKKKRLKRFWLAFCKEHKALCDRYEMHGVGDSTYLAHQKLAEIGVDVAAWYKELEALEE